MPPRSPDLIHCEFNWWRNSKLKCTKPSLTFEELGNQNCHEISTISIGNPVGFVPLCKGYYYYYYYYHHYHYHHCESLCCFLSRLLGCENMWTSVSWALAWLLSVNQEVFHHLFIAVVLKCADPDLMANLNCSVCCLPSCETVPGEVLMHVGRWHNVAVPISFLWAVMCKLWSSVSMEAGLFVCHLIGFVYCRGEQVCGCGWHLSPLGLKFQQFRHWLQQFQPL